MKNWQLLTNSIAKHKALAALTSTVAAATILLSSCSNEQPKLNSAPTSNQIPIQIGWMTSWATAGQLMQALIHTNISQLYGLDLVFKSFLFGPDINEAALHDEVDCINSGLVPTITLLAKSSDWVVVGKLIDSPLSVIARNGSGIEKLEDLKGKTIAVPFGGGSHPYVIQLISKVGLKCGEKGDMVRLINLKPSEQAIAIKQGSVDAVGTWEPQTAIIQAMALGRVINMERHIGVITVRKSIAEKQPEKIVQLLKAYIQANFYVAGHRQKTDNWFAEASHMDNKLVASIQVIEPNAKAQSLENVDINLTAADLELAQNYADTMDKNDLLPKPVTFKERTDLTFLKQALKELARDGYKTDKITEAESTNN